MPTTNYAAREIHCKIVYVGPGRSGKTTNLRQIAARVQPASRGQLLTMGAAPDGMGAFELLPVEVGELHGFRTRFQLHTVPGAVRLTEVRHRILTGVDGLVFVADADPDRLDANVVALHDLQSHLAAQGRALAEVPLIIQCNKRDLPRPLPIAALWQALDADPRTGDGLVGPVPMQEAVARDGLGVFETLKVITQAVVEDLMAHGAS